MAVTYTKLGTASRNPNGQSAHALSSWTQIIASTAANYQGLMVMAYQTGSNGGRIAVSLSTGTAGNEPASSFVDDLLFQQSANYQTTHIIPIPVTSGSRVALAFRCHNASTATILFHVYGVTATAGELPSGITAIRPLNYDNTTTLATAVFPGDSGSTAVKGAYVELTSSLSATVAGFGVCPVVNNITVSAVYLIDIATGGSGSESVVIPDVPARRVTGNDPYFTTTFFPCPVASGTRVAGRQQADTTTVTVRDIGVVVYAYYGTFTAPSSSATKLVNGGLVG